MIHYGKFEYQSKGENTMYTAHELLIRAERLESSIDPENREMFSKILAKLREIKAAEEARQILLMGADLLITMLEAPANANNRH
jgi:hypothetical protein